MNSELEVTSATWHQTLPAKPPTFSSSLLIVRFCKINKIIKSCY